MATDKATIAVLFGGRSVEHDVSVLTGIQFLEALDQTRFTGLAVYVDPNGQWWTGSSLLKRSFYPLTADKAATLQAVTMPTGLGIGKRPCLMTSRKTLMGQKVDEIPFDLLVPAIHGSNGEDGTLQGLLSFSSIPHAGSRTLGSALSMDKHATKEMLSGKNIPLLPHLLVDRPETGGFVGRKELLPALEKKFGADIFPAIVKPRNLGSSVGVSAVQDPDTLEAAIATVFRMDKSALIEPLVQNLVEYNVAVMRRNGVIETSAIEKPLKSGELLDFKTKYLAGSRGGPKLDDAPSEGMASLNRELNPDNLTPEQDALIRNSAITAFDTLDLAGTVRVDFLSNEETGEIWLNEVNSIPGSFAYFLWQAAQNPLSFTALATHMVEEGLAFHRTRQGDTSATTGNARIFAGD